MDGMGHEEISFPQNSPSPVVDEIFKIAKTCKYRNWEPVFGKKHTAKKRLVNAYLDVFGGKWTKKHLRKEKHFLWHWLNCGFKHFLVSPLPMEMIRFDLRISFKWVVQPTTSRWIIGPSYRPSGDLGLPPKEMALALAERMEVLQLHRDVFTYSALISACVPWLATGTTVDGRNPAPVDR